jgi:hypothetical protein
MTLQIPQAPEGHYFKIVKVKYVTEWYILKLYEKATPRTGLFGMIAPRTDKFIEDATIMVEYYNDPQKAVNAAAATILRRVQSQINMNNAFKDVL